MLKNKPVLTLLALLSVTLSSLTCAATITVTNLNDSGAGSFRQAVADAASGDRIVFNQAGAIILSSGWVVIDKSLEIRGFPNQKVELHGEYPYSILRIKGRYSDVQLIGLTFKFGSNEFHGKTGYYSDGGAIYNGGNLRISNSSFYDNTADRGGAIFNDGRLKIINSTFFRNLAIDGGFGCATGGYGGAIYNNGIVSLANTTFSKNAGDCGAFYAAENSKTKMVNTIFQQTYPGTPIASPSCTLESGAVVISLGYNIDEFNYCGFNQATDMENTDPMLGDYLYNGGPSDTMMPVEGSPAIDSGGDSYAPPRDQIGTRRPQGPASDIGAVEIVVF